MTIRVPMTPSPALSPNMRVHWATKMRAVATFRQVARVAALASTTADERATLTASPTIGYRVRVSWEPGRRGMRDEDNVLAACKAALDGIADALEIDDARLKIRGIDIDRETREGVTVFTMIGEEA
mgnify:CR=1 FL=1